MNRHEIVSGGRNLRNLSLTGLLLLSGNFLLCSGPGPTSLSDEVEIHVTPMPGGGFNDTGRSGSNPGSSFDAAWAFIPGFGRQGDPDACDQQGLCSVGGTVKNLGALTAPFNPDAVPDDDGNPSTWFEFISTQNYIDFGDPPIVVLKSGLQQTIIIPAAGTLRLKFDYAFLTGEYNTGPARNDVASVLLLLDNDEGNPITVLRVDRNLLQPGGSGPVANSALPAPAGCGSSTISGVTAEYPLCTGWQSHSFDLTPYKGRTVTLRLLVEEVGGDNEAATVLAFDNFRIVEVHISGGG